MLIVQLLDTDRKIIFPFEQTRCHRDFLSVPPGGLSDSINSFSFSVKIEGKFNEMFPTHVPIRIPFKYWDGAP
jgi:hypothetical protein